MYKELITDIEGFQHPRHGDLTGWAKQGSLSKVVWMIVRCNTQHQTCYLLHLWPPSSGVLLLNAVLTVRAHQANSHKDKGWETFTDAVVQWLSNNQEGIVFILWGAYAQKKGATINRVRGKFSFLILFEAMLFILCAWIYVYVYVCRNGTTSCRRCILLPCLLTVDSLAADISQRPMIYWKNLESHL